MTAAMLRTMFLCAGVIVSFTVSAFEIDGLRTGLSPAESITQLKRLGLQIRQQEGGSILATGPGDPPGGRLYSLTFCRGGLVTVQKNLVPSFGGFVELIHRFSELYGSPIEIFPRLPDPTNYVQSHSLSISWRHQGELATAQFTSFSSNDQLSVRYYAPNRCYRIHLLGQ